MGSRRRRWSLGGGAARGGGGCGARRRGLGSIYSGEKAVGWSSAAVASRCRPAGGAAGLNGARPRSRVVERCTGSKVVQGLRDVSGSGEHRAALCGVRTWARVGVAASGTGRPASGAAMRARARRGGE